MYSRRIVRNIVHGDFYRQQEEKMHHEHEDKQERIEVVLSERRPVSIVPAEWPAVARAAMLNAYVTVRVHKDGRRLVYGTRGVMSGGFLLEAGEPEAETARAIRRVFGILALRGDAAERCVQELIRMLPSEAL